MQAGSLLPGARAANAGCRAPRAHVGKVHRLLHRHGFFAARPSPASGAAIVEGGAGSIMCAYNRVDGLPACASDLLLGDILRGDWGFRGYVVSDCDAVTDIHRHHHFARDAASAVAAALRAGVDSECSGATLTDSAGLDRPYREALARGLITVADVDRALVRLFAARYRTGDLPGLRPLSTDSASPDEVGTPAHGALALEAAEKSLVLLKNDGVLPLASAPRIAVIVAPGGGFGALSMENEGWAVARTLAEHGVAAFVLKYRLKQTPADLDGAGAPRAGPWSSTSTSAAATASACTRRTPRVPGGSMPTCAG